MSEEKKRNRMVDVLMLGALIVIGIVVYKQANKPDAIDAQLQTPESALKFYLQTAWAHMHASSGENVEKIKRCVTQNDWDWYYNNVDSLFSDSFKLTSAIDPNEAAAGKRIMVLSSILELSPNREDAAFVNVVKSGTSATITVSKLLDGGTSVNVPVSLVKEGKVWKVKDFGGARSAITSGTGTAAPPPVAGF